MDKSEWNDTFSKLDDAKYNVYDYERKNLVKLSTQIQEILDSTYFAETKKYPNEVYNGQKEAFNMALNGAYPDPGHIKHLLSEYYDILGKHISSNMRVMLLSGIASIFVIIFVFLLMYKVDVCRSNSFVNLCVGVIPFFFIMQGALDIIEKIIYFLRKNDEHFVGEIVLESILPRIFLFPMFFLLFLFLLLISDFFKYPIAFFDLIGILFGYIYWFRCVYVILKNQPKALKKKYLK